MVATLNMAKPEASNSGSKRVAVINDDPNYAVDFRNNEIKAVSEVLEKSGIQHIIGTTPDGDFIEVNENLHLLNEFFYNSAIKQKEWKVRIMVDKKYVSHYKASHTDKILAKVKQVLA